MRALVALALCACTSSSGTTALFAQNGSDFYDLPYPNDLRRHDDGSLDLSKFPTNSLLVDMYRVDAEKLDGFGLNSAIFARFSGPLDETSLPDPAASTMPGASVYLVNLTTGDYSRGASGFLIEKGEITRPIAEFTVAGNLKAMFAALTPANDLEFRYGINVPTLRIDGMTVAG